MTGSTLSQLMTEISRRTIKVIDLTQPLHPATPILQLPPPWDGNWAFQMEEISRYDERGPAWYWNNFKCCEHTGTHFDAPIHWISGKDHQGNATDTIPVESFIAPACVIDVVERVKANPDFLLSVDDVLAWEKTHGKIDPRSWVLLRTGWSKREDPTEYLNPSPTGPHTPGPHGEVVKFLVEQRDVLGFGTETVGTDAGQAFGFDPPFPCHAGMHGANKFGLASLTNLDKLPPRGAVILAAPLKIRQGSGSPLRVLALVEST